MFDVPKLEVINCYNRYRIIFHLPLSSSILRNVFKLYRIVYLFFMYFLKNVKFGFKLYSYKNTSFLFL